MKTTAKERLYFNQDRSKIVGHHDPNAATLYASVGTVIPDEMSEKFGLHGGWVDRKSLDQAQIEDKALKADQNKAAKVAAEAETKRIKADKKASDMASAAHAVKDNKKPKKPAKGGLTIVQKTPRRAGKK